MNLSIRRGFQVLIFLCAASVPACVSPTTGTTIGTASNLSGKTDIPMLVPAGKSERWKLRNVAFDEDGQPSYSIWLKNPSRLESHYGFGIHASGTRHEIPKTYEPDGYSPERKPIDLSPEIFIPAIGRKVHYYCESGAGGSENAIFATEPIAWPDGHGGTVYYVIRTESDEPEKILHQVKWAKPGSMKDAKVEDNGTIYVR